MSSATLAGRPAELAIFDIIFLKILEQNFFFKKTSKMTKIQNITKNHKK